jgi:5-formyltetrahydrofolate cyclo-ligase
VIPLEKVEVALVPGLAFDLRGHRLGRGGGHYDRVLARLSPDSITIGLAFELQLMKRLPVEVHDVPVDLIVTEIRVIKAAEAGRGSTMGPRRR